ncbi:uncharacterized protein TNCV_1246921 [Trichonephila clavipes]|uniref:Uncharacterized protein n=1 Tax=Trichonephila clavipes TaxID=2585209 RepID=A0A8X6V120_TRICX|nr:uncharacterized protein TNCV_1246921 [Trichonephila clavipes]
MVLCGIPIPDFHKRILFRDEAHFWLNGYVNKQNCRIWSEANPQVYVETPLHPEKLTVWCALWAGGIIGPYIFKNDEGQIGLHPSQPWHDVLVNRKHGRDGCVTHASSPNVTSSRMMHRCITFRTGSTGLPVPDEKCIDSRPIREFRRAYETILLPPSRGNVKCERVVQNNGNRCE